jgi:hypothetical protein
MKQRQRHAEHDQRHRPQEHGKAGDTLAVAFRRAARRAVIDLARIDLKRAAAMENTAMIESTTNTAPRPNT